MKRDNSENIKFKRLKKKEVFLPCPSFLLQQKFRDDDIDKLRKKIRKAVKFYFEEICDNEMYRENGFGSDSPSKRIGQC